MAEHSALAATPIGEQDWRKLVAIRCVLTFFVSVAIYTLIVQMSFLLAERGVTSPSTIGVGIAFGAGGIALGSIANTAMVSASSRFRLLICYALMTGGFGTISLVPGFSAMCFGALTAGLGAGCAVSTLLCSTVKNVPGSFKGQATGAWTAAMFLGQFLNPPIFLGLVLVGRSHARAFLIYSGICMAIFVGFAIAALVSLTRTQQVSTFSG
jgi:MFS family permease